MVEIVKSDVHITDNIHLRYIINQNFPKLHQLFYIHPYVTYGDIDNLRKLCNYQLPVQYDGGLTEINPLLNYMVDNKHLYDTWAAWWQL